MRRPPVTDRDHVRAPFARALERGGLLCVVIVAHFAGFLFFSVSEVRRLAIEVAAVGRPEDRMTIFWIQPSDSEEEAAGAARTSEPVRQASRKREWEEAEEPTESLPPAAIAPREPIDWAREAEIVAGEQLLT